MGFQHVMPFNLLNAQEKFFPVQTGEVTLDPESTTVTIAGVDLTKSVLEFSSEYNTAAGDPSKVYVRGEITNSTTLTFTRNNGSDAHIIRWYVWEARPTTPMTVQRGTQEVGNSASLPVNVSISAIDLSKTFVKISQSGSGSTPTSDDPVRAKITTTTNLELDIDTVQGGTMIVAYQVIQNTQWSVDQYDVTFSVTSLNFAISSVPRADAYVVASGEFGATVNGNRVARFAMESDIQVRFSRSDSTDSWLITMYVVDTKGDMLSVHSNLVILAGQTSTSLAITAIDQTKSFARVNSLINGTFSTFNGAGIDGDHILTKIFYTSDTLITLERGNISVSSSTEAKSQSHSFA